MVCCLCTGILYGAIALGVAYFVKTTFFPKKPRKSPIKEDWKEGVVYLYQFPRTNYVPSLSPFCLKVETWLKFHGIKYENVRCKAMTGHKSKEGMLPFVELNGKEYDDSSFIITQLTELLDQEEVEGGLLTPEQKGASRAFENMIDNTTWLSYASIRYGEQLDTMLSEKVIRMKFPFYLQPLIALAKPKIRQKMMNNSVNRHPRPMRIAIGLDDLRAVSTYLGTKPYMMGDKPTRVDAALFGIMAQILYIEPITTPHRAVMQGECKNLEAYCNRIRDTYWSSDWN